MAEVYDLHCHSTASDGVLSPRALVQRARAHGVDILALTDHDTTAGLDEAAEAARVLGLSLLRGIEISVTWRRATVHIVGLHIDSANPALEAGLERLREFRRWRAEEIGRRLAKAGIEGAYDGASRYAGGALISRTHFARFLVEKGHAKDVGRVFKHYLAHNKPGHVPGQWATLDEAVSWIRGAGGQAVVAHPVRYKYTKTRLRQLLTEFKDCGGEGLEVVSSSHNREERAAMAALAAHMGLKASAGSDFHAPGNPHIELGFNLALPSGCQPIWQDWSLRPVA